jgi:hypothetical protein
MLSAFAVGTLLMHVRNEVFEPPGVAFARGRKSGLVPLSAHVWLPDAGTTANDPHAKRYLGHESFAVSHGGADLPWSGSRLVEFGVLRS